MPERAAAKSLTDKFLTCIHNSWMAQAAYVAAELQLADLLAENPRTCEDLASATGTHAPSLYRLLRALTTIDICREREDGFFEITPMGSLLSTDAPGSLRSWTIWWGSDLWRVWGNLLYSVKTGKSARKLITGKGEFKNLEKDHEAAKIFNQALVELTRLTAENVVQTYDFSGLKRIADVGGGYGELLASILRSNPTIKGMLFDMPHAIEGGKKYFKKAGLISRCKFVEGDFFKSIPDSADAYILKSVLHDWDNKKSRLILKNCRHAMTAGDRLLIVERVVPERLEISGVHQELMRTDLTMLVTHAAQERTTAEFRELLESADFQIVRILPIGLSFNIIEAFPV